MVVRKEALYMLRRNRRKMGIALILFIAGLMLMRLAFASIASDISVVLIVIGTFLLLGSMFVFAKYFKE